MKSFGKMAAALAAVIFIVAMAISVSVSQTSNDEIIGQITTTTSEQHSVKHDASCPHHIHDLLARESGICSCGGRLTTDYRAFQKKVPCPACPNHRGYEVINGRKVKCNTCKGKRFKIEYETGFRCTRKNCGKKYRQW